jgi:hypothetical protein
VTHTFRSHSTLSSSVEPSQHEIITTTI